MTARSRKPENSLVQCAISENDASEKYEVAVYADMVQVKVQGAKVRGDYNPGGSLSRRGAISSFSKRSRNRLIKAMCQKRDYVRPLFVTLTFSDEAWFDQYLGYSDLSAKLHHMNTRIRQRFPQSGHIWRKEWEFRKTGRFTGHLAPHVHMIVDGITEDLSVVREWFWKAWAQVTMGDETMRSRVDIQVAKSRRHAMYYVAKYVSKVEDEWYFSTTSESDVSRESPGRFWGVVGNWNRTAVLTVRLTREQFLELRRTARKWLKKRKTRHWRLLATAERYEGFSVFGLGDQSHPKWLDLWDSDIVRLILHLTAT